MNKEATERTETAFSVASVSSLFKILVLPDMVHDHRKLLEPRHATVRSLVVGDQYLLVFLAPWRLGGSITVRLFCDHHEREPAAASGIRSPHSGQTPLTLPVRL